MLQLSWYVNIFFKYLKVGPIIDFWVLTLVQTDFSPKYVQGNDSALGLSIPYLQNVSGNTSQNLKENTSQKYAFLLMHQ